MTKKMLIFTPFVVLAVWGFVLVLFILGGCKLNGVQVLCNDGEWQLLEASLLIWGVLLLVLPLLMSFGLIKLASATAGKLGESEKQ